MPVTVVTTVTTLAGSGTAAFANGTGAAASFNGPSSVVVDAAGNVYVTDRLNNRIRKVTPAGMVTTLAGSGTEAFADGTGTAASFSSPSGVALDPAGNLYVCDANNYRIRKVTTGGVVTTLAGSGAMAVVDGQGVAAGIDGPVAIAVNGAGVAYIADVSGNRIRQMTPTGLVTTLAGSDMGAFADGTGFNASFFHPWGVALDAAGKLYVSDFSNNRIRVVTSTGVVTTLAGSGSGDIADGTGSAASFNQPQGIAVDARGNVYVADTANSRIRRIAPGGIVTTLAGSDANAFADGVDGAASFNGPAGIALDTGGVLYVADGGNNRIRKVTMVGIGQLAVTWSAPMSAGSSAITGYTASATAAGQPTKTCAASDATTCTIGGLTTGVTYTVSVTATNNAGMSPPSASGSATPN